MGVLKSHIWALKTPNDWTERILCLTRSLPAASARFSGAKPDNSKKRNVPTPRAARVRGEPGAHGKARLAG